MHEYIFYQVEFRNLVGLPAKEVLGLNSNNSCDGGPLLPLDKRLRRRFELHEREDDFSSLSKRGKDSVKSA